MIRRLFDALRGEAASPTPEPPRFTEEMIANLKQTIAASVHEKAQQLFPETSQIDVSVETQTRADYSKPHGQKLEITVRLNAMTTEIADFFAGGVNSFSLGDVVPSLSAENENKLNTLRQQVEQQLQEEWQVEAQPMNLYTRQMVKCVTDRPLDNDDIGQKVPVRYVFSWEVKFPSQSE